MVDMGMGDKDKIQTCGPVVVHVEIALFNLFVALMHAAINTEAMSAGFKDVAGTGYGLRGAKEIDLHVSPAFKDVRGNGAGKFRQHLFRSCRILCTRTYPGKSAC